MPRKTWPPPGFPLVEGEHALTEEWNIHLPEQFARRIEDGQLVLWRPGLTIWLAAWGNDENESQASRLKWIKSEASPDRFEERKSSRGGLTRYDYRLRDESEDGPVEALYAYVIGDEGHLQMAIYFDDPSVDRIARILVDSVAARNVSPKQ
jgi:hypothetical protein